MADVAFLNVAQVDGPQTFAAEGDRARLSATALKAFRRLSEHWDLTNQEAAALLGVSTSTWDRIKGKVILARIN